MCVVSFCHLFGRSFPRSELGSIADRVIVLALCPNFPLGTSWSENRCGSTNPPSHRASVKRSSASERSPATIIIRYFWQEKLCVAARSRPGSMRRSFCCGVHTYIWPLEFYLVFLPHQKIAAKTDSFSGTGGFGKVSSIHCWSWALADSVTVSVIPSSKICQYTIS